MNSYWRSPRSGRLAGRVLVSEAGRTYRKTVSDMVGEARLRLGLRARLLVELVACPPDRRKRDLDNLLKPLLDAMQHAGVYEDDSQIDRLVIERGEVVTGGRLEVHVLPIGMAGVSWRQAMGDDA
jgi:crossover junction endodeoxyribonuclease RusA